MTIYSEFPIRWYPDRELQPWLSEELSGVQANVLHSHGRRRLAHLVLRVTNRDDARASLASLDVTDALQEARRLTNGGSRADLVTLCYLSATGMDKIGFQPPDPIHRAFHTGFKNEQRPDQGWDPAYRNQVDAMVSVAGPDEPGDSNEDALLAEVERLQGALAGFEIIMTEWGQRIDGGKEHFGHVDNISNPRFFAWDVYNNRPKGLPEAWHEGKPPKIVLVPEGNAGYGSFFVFQKLQQDRDHFERLVSSKVDQVKHAAESGDKKAMLIGRKLTGEVEWASYGRAGHVAPRHNDFDYRDGGRDGRGFGTWMPHIRAVNRREPGFPLIARRSMPYGNGNDQPYGLLFGAYMASIDDQFEVIEKAARAQNDPLIPSRTNRSVVLQGGEYFYAPSPKRLKALATQPSSA